MAIIFHVKQGEPPESIVQEKKMLLEEAISIYGKLACKFYGEYFPIIDDDNHSSENHIVLKVVEKDKKWSPYDKIGYYLLIE